MEELMARRKDSKGIDECGVRSPQGVRFAEQIAYAVSKHLTPRVSDLAGIEEIYGFHPASAKAVSLTSHPFCVETSDTLKAIMFHEDIPSGDTIDKLNRMTAKLNAARLAGNAESTRLWTKFFGCLAYEESLTTADGPSSQKVARQVLHWGETKPDGVEFYNDPEQSNPASKLNIGLYQFSPLASGNIAPCIREWNKAFPKCEIDVKASRTDLIRTLGSSAQSFNAYCGVDKLVQTFFVQANTQAASRLHPANKGKESADRCVSLNFRASLGYNHFGPLQNSTGKSLNHLVSCVLQGE
jgi:hypothetical protein